MTDKTQLLQDYDQAHEELRRLLPGIDRRRRIYPAWTVKELLAHLAGWDDAIILTLEALRDGKPAPLIAPRGPDVYNAQTVAERAELAYEQVVKEWEWVRDRVVALLEAFEPEQLEQDAVTPWGVPMPVEQLIRFMIEHEKEHARYLRELQAAVSE